LRNWGGLGLIFCWLSKNLWGKFSHPTIKVWRLRVGATTTDNYIRCSPNPLQKPQLEQFGTTALLGGMLGWNDYSQIQRETQPQQRDE